MQYPEPIARLIDSYMKLPGIGQKTATRLAFYTIDMKEEVVNEFAKSLLSVKRDLHFCSICGNITEEEAKAIALEHAGVKEEDIRRLNINTYSKNRIEVFEVEFYVGNNEFEYYIEIETGEIIGFSLDIEDLNKLPLLSTNDQIIDLEKAFGIAIEKAQVSKEDIRELSIEFENYGRRAIYEIEFEAGRDEFEIVVDATNGEIIKFERDR